MTTVERNVFANREREARAQAITERVQADLLDHMRDFQKEAPRYIREYVDTIVGPKTTRRPKPRMHTKLAELIRELALEEATCERRKAA